MRIRSLCLRDHSPIQHFEIGDLGNTVIIAGANGSGKTRLKEALVRSVQGNPLMDMTIEATRPEEEDEKYFGAHVIAVAKGEKNDKLRNYINSRQYGSGRYVGSLVQIDSTRSVQSVNYSQVNWLAGDPDDADSAGTFYFSPFVNRWQDFMNYIHQKSAARDKKIAEAMKRDPQRTGDAILETNPDPLDKYKVIFSAILPGKTLLDIDPASPREFRYTDEKGQELEFKTLSSGEQEVIKVLFDVARKDIRHSIIIVDEPELHLHPTLAFKLIESLKSIGDHTNQFFFLTHSADLISTYYSSGDVYFIDPTQKYTNQAHRLSDLDQNHSDLVSLIGQNLGMFAVGKKLVFVEGEDSSIDRLVYQTIAHRIDSEIRVVPAGSVLNLMALNNIERQIREAIFGIELYMVRDRDGLSDQQVANLEQNGRIRCLRRRHLENYFLDPEILFIVADRLYITRRKSNLTIDSIARDMQRIAEQSVTYNLFKCVKEEFNLNYFLSPPSVSLRDERTIESVKAELEEAILLSAQHVAGQLSRDNVRDWIAGVEIRIRQELESGRWIETFQGKYLFAKACADILGEDRLRVRHAYIDIALKKKPEIITEVADLFRHM